MIGTLWPWQRLAPQRRTFLWLAILLISASGLIAGLALRPLTHGLMGSGSSLSVAGSTPPATGAGTATATLVPAVTTPQRFALRLDVPAPTAAGGAMTITAHALVGAFDSQGNLTGPTKAAQGVACRLSFDPAAAITLPGAQTTDDKGAIVFTIVIPSGTPAGTYKVHGSAAWASFHADYYVLAKIT